MEWSGHAGVALVLYAPVAAVLLGSGLRGLALVGGAVTLSLASLPDCDLLVPGVPHRGPTHSVLFAVVVALVVGVAGFVVGSPIETSGGLTFGVALAGLAFLTMLSHLLADSITPMGVRPFWPVSSRSYSLGLVYSNDWVWNVALLTLGGFAVGLVAISAL